MLNEARIKQNFSSWVPEGKSKARKWLAAKASGGASAGDVVAGDSSGSGGGITDSTSQNGEKGPHRRVESMSSSP